MRGAKGRYYACPERAINLAMERASELLLDRSGVQFDPACVEAFFQHWEDILDIALQFQDDILVWLLPGCEKNSPCVVGFCIMGSFVKTYQEGVMTVEYTQSNVLERRLQLSIPLVNVRQETETRLRKMSRTVRIQGFRPGKVPYRMVAQQYGSIAEEEAINALAQRCFGEEIRTLKLAVAGSPRFDAVASAETDRFQFEATFEVYPEVVFGSWEGRSLDKIVAKVEEVDVQRTVDMLRQQRVTYHAIHRAAATGDRVTLDFKGILDGVEFPGGSGSDMAVILGSGRFLPEFEQGLTGVMAGEEKSFPVHFPDNYGAADLAGKTATFHATVKEVAEPVLPEINADFLASIGVNQGGEAELRAELRTNLEREVRQKVGAQLKEAVMSLLLEVAPTPVPMTFVQTEIKRMRENLIEETRERSPQATMPDHLPDNLFEATARRRVALGLILAELVRQKKITTTAQEVRALVEELSSAYEDPDDVIRWTYQNTDQLRQVEGVALEEAVVRWVCGKVDVREIPRTFAELAQSPQGQPVTG